MTEPATVGERRAAAQRRRRIAELLADEGGASVDRLAELLGVTASTIRRDLSRLTSQGRITRTYGGAVVAGHPPGEPSLRERASRARAQKDAIGAWAADQIGDGETVILDAGTTTGAIARHLRDRTGLTVVTNGLTAMAELSASDRIEVVVLGGSLRHVSQGLVGPLTDLALERLTADRVFLGADGLTTDRGICEASVVQTRTKELMAARARAVYVVADASKIGQAPFHAWAPLPLPYTLVTDDGVDEQSLAGFRALPGIEIVVVPVAGRRV